MENETETILSLTGEDGSVLELNYTEESGYVVLHRDEEEEAELATLNGEYVDRSLAQSVFFHIAKEWAEVDEDFDDDDDFDDLEDEDEEEEEPTNSR
jgi:hypothetical protein